jgi:riboflavin synthase
MFTGIVQATGTVAARTDKGGDAEFVFQAQALGLEDVAVGDSIACSGCCLTVTRLTPSTFSADVSRESLSVTTLADWRVGSAVNFEKALRAAQPLGGHYVSGHVDGVATVVDVHSDARSTRVEIETPKSLARYVAQKGSVCLDGVSLTVNAAEGARFGVNLIPHTLQVTSLEHWRAGSRINLEVDMIARYLERLMSGV